MFTNPIKNLKALGVRDTDIIADLGAGTGFYTIALSPMVPFGKVYAIELHEDFMKTIQNKAKEHHFKNVQCFLGDVERPGGTKLASGVLDKAIVSNLLHQIEDRSKFMAELKRILKPEGRVLLVDYSGESPAFSAKHAITEADARRIFEDAGFRWERGIDAGAHHYGMIFIRP
ncbi:MAG: class I SAM-dependent methyltransferase [Candidatus Paceibacterota bacterium]